MATPKEHIDQIRKTKFSIGGEPNPLTEDLHEAVKHLSAELYAKDVHFLMELIQNAEDNEYAEGVDPSLEFIITSRDITGTGAPATLLLFNNEKGFSPRNIESICSVGRSTKKGNRKRGYIGEKGIGFKSVFLICAQPYIFSNGYQITFKEAPCPHCNVGYIVPEWVEENPTLSDINKIYGSAHTLPTTTIVLPLKPDKVKPVKQQLSIVHPEILLFLSKIKQLSIKEENENPNLNTVSAISILSETNFITRKNIDAMSYTLHLSAAENSNKSESECSYYMWKQKFPVMQQNQIERRKEVEEWVITLAFPFGQRLQRGMSKPGVYAFLPTEMVTNFPFIIQADFILASSRETILLDNKWNQGILECVPTAFVNAFSSLVKTSEGSPSSSLACMFNFLPVNNSSFPKLNTVRESIREKLVEENIVPCESHMEQRFFCKPREVGRLFPSFWNILNKARKQGLNFHNLSSHGRYVLNSEVDREEYDLILNFLGVEHVDDEWYAKCIKSSNLVLGVSEDVYLDILHFVVEKWGSCSQYSSMMSIPLMKYLGSDGNVSLCSINEAIQWDGKQMLLMSRNSCHTSWLIDWNHEFRCVAGSFFLPKQTEDAIRSCSKRDTILEWLKEKLKVHSVGVNAYAALLKKHLSTDKKLIVTYVHFLYHSFSNNYLFKHEVDNLCSNMPLLDNYGDVTTRRVGVLVPANGSKWAGLIGSNPWRVEGYIELGEAYLRSGKFAGLFTPQNQLIKFLKTHVDASDVPDLSPPNAVIPSLSPLTKQNAFLLLDWIHNLTCRGVGIPRKFLECIQNGSWLRVSLSRSPGYRSPSQSFMPSSSWGDLLQNGSVLADIPLIDQDFYGYKINDYKAALKTVGVMFEYGDACKYIGKHLMSSAASSMLTKSNVLSMLKFIKYLREKYLSPSEFIHSIREGKWLRTTVGDRSPVGSVLYDEEWRTASQISDIPFVDIAYYGDEVLQYKTELELLGVIVGFKESYQLVADCLKTSTYLTSLTSEAVLLILRCMRHSKSSDKLVKAIKDQKILKTDTGFKTPCECFLSDPEWGSLLQVFNSFPHIDLNFYGSIFFKFKKELCKIGVVSDLEGAVKAFAAVFRQKASSSSIGKENVFLFLSCYRQLKSKDSQIPLEIKKCIREVKWLRTRLCDYRSPKDCILFGPAWEFISPISLLPFIDDSSNFYGEGICEYERELKNMGVVSKLKDGVKFVADGLYLPQNPSIITPANTMSLLDCIRILQQEQSGSLPEAFLKKVSRKWLKTHAGYSSPDKSLLFDSKWSCLLQQTDGPFIDEGFYGSNIKSYRTELNAIGVIIDPQYGCQLLASHLDFHSEFATILRIYSYLSEMKWEPGSDAARRIWIPNGSDKGEWVSPGECVLHDKDGLFGSQLIVLEKHYERNLLSFFSSAFDVKSHPSIDDYCKLWKVWESSGSRLSHVESCAFWGYVLKHWNKKMEETLSNNLVKLPVRSELDGILLMDKQDVFLADDLQLKDLFEHSSAHPIFVWSPQSSFPALPRTKLLEVYRKIGVRTISEAVHKEELSLVNGDELKQVNPKEFYIGKSLSGLILGYLSDPSVKMEAEKRHESVKCLSNPMVFETVEPITVRYSLTLSSGENMNVERSQMIRWDRENCKFYMQKIERSGGLRNVIEYATYYSEVISNGVLWDNQDLIGGLSELIKVAFLLGFNEEAVDFLMKNKNLQIFAEDAEFLSSFD